MKSQRKKYGRWKFSKKFAFRNGDSLGTSLGDLVGRPLIFIKLDESSRVWAFNPPIRTRNLQQDRNRVEYQLKTRYEIIWFNSSDIKKCKKNHSLNMSKILNVECEILLVCTKYKTYKEYPNTLFTVQLL